MSDASLQSGQSPLWSTKGISTVEEYIPFLVLALGLRGILDDPLNFGGQSISLDKIFPVVGLAVSDDAIVAGEPALHRRRPRRRDYREGVVCGEGGSRQALSIGLVLAAGGDVGLLGWHRGASRRMVLLGG